MQNQHKTKLWKHLAALIYDIFPIVGIFLTTSMLIVIISGGNEIPPGTWWLQGIFIVELVLYFCYSWKKGGQTLGMRAWKLGIAEYHKMSWAQAGLRFLAGVLSVCCLGLGLWLRPFNRSQQTWMDLASGHLTIDLSIPAN